MSKDEKDIQDHIEDVRERGSIEESKGVSGNRVADNDARNYLNPDVVITEEMNKQMRRRVHKR